MAQSNAAATAVRNIWNTTELKEKILFTLLCLLVYRIGAHVTAPGVNPAALVDFFRNQSNGGGLLGLYDLFTGGQLSRATVFALGIMPYISASIFQQIAGAVLPQIEKMQKDEEGRKRVNQWTRYATVVLAAVQAWGFALFTESLPGVVDAPGFGFRLQMTFFLTTGAVFVMWLGEQITERGLGNGASLMIFFSIVERIWPSVFQTFKFLSTGALGAFAQFFGSPRVRDFADLFSPGTTLYYILSAGLILFFTYFYTSIIFNPVDLAENLKKQGGFIPGVKPGAKTAEYIDEVMSRITLPGALFLTLIALLPIWIADVFNVPFRFGGTSLLIVVGVALDTMAQMQQHLLLRKYDGFMKKGRVRFRGRAPMGGGGSG